MGLRGAIGHARDMRHALLIMTVGLLAGCAMSIEDIPTNPAPHPTHDRTPDEVELLTAGPPPRP
jgi:hypothetical protein